MLGAAVGPRVVCGVAACRCRVPAVAHAVSSSGFAAVGCVAGASARGESLGGGYVISL